jgi:predicted nucleic acid-binding protein
MKTLFADTFYWVALSDSRDSAHEQALAITSERASSQIVTTDEVLGEYLTFFAKAPAQIRREVTASVLDILASKAIDVLPQSRESFLAGLSLYSSRPDKGSSLIDCISMQVNAP